MIFIRRYGGAASARVISKYQKMSSFVLCLLLIHTVSAVSYKDPLWSIIIGANDTTIHMDETLSIPIRVDVAPIGSSNYTIEAVSSDTNVATVNNNIQRFNNRWNGTIQVSGLFLGSSRISLSIFENKDKKGSGEIKITVIRKERVVDRVFTGSVIILVSVLYINFGCAMDWGVCRKTLKHPVGPAIGFFCQFIIMPLLSYGIAYYLFPEHPELQIGMFFTGISPSGGASNIWTLLLDGNINLSVTLTTLCTIASFGTMPLWIFTLGKRIFERGELTVPYAKVANFAIGLIIPLTIGYIIQKKLPRFSRIMVRIMKPFSGILIVFIIIFAVVTNLYLFKLFSWQIVVAGMGLPWLGFISGMVTAFLFKQPLPDIKAIAIETGIQNTGVAIFLLRVSLPQPAADLTTVLPVSIAIMTPIPLTLLYVAKLIWDRRSYKKEKTTVSQESLQNIGEQAAIVHPSGY